MKIQVLLTWVTGAVLLASSEHVPPGTKLKKLCSSELSNAYVLACLGAEPSTDFFMKRNLMPLPALNALTTMPQVSDRVYLPWLTSRRHSLIPQRVRLGKRMNSGGLVDECCLKPCYIEELLNYCP